MEHASPGYLKYYFFERHLLGYVTDGQEHHGTPWYYYLGPAIGGSMPWFVFAAVSFIQSRYENQKRAGRPELLLACWFIGGVVFLSAAGSRLITYSLPVFPPIAILAGLGFRQYFHQELANFPRRLFKNNFRMAAVFGIIAPIPTLSVLSKFFDAPSPWTAYLVAGLASLAMAIGFVAFERRAERYGLAIGMLWFPLLVICLMTWPVQKLADENSQRSLAALVATSKVKPQKIVLVGQRVGSLWFYLPAEKQADFSRGQIREVEFSQIPNFLPPPSGVLFAATSRELKRRKWDVAMSKLNPRAAGGFCVIQGQEDNGEVALRREGSFQ
jgi:4-amino-4-deoxy-L-arabinose transferase-like glycosyltransferase